MKTRSIPWTVLLLAAAPAGCELEHASSEDYEAELVDAISDSARSVVDASDSGSPLLAVAAAQSAACDATTEVLAFAPLCSGSYRSRVSLTWSCVGPGGNGASGSALVDTTLTPDDCPATEISAEQAVTLSRLWRLGDVRATLEGTADLAWSHDVGQEALGKSVGVNLEHHVYKGDELVRNQLLSGTRQVTFDVNGPGDLDDTRVVDGSLSVTFALAEVQASVTETDLTFRTACCHPIAGSIDYQLSGASERSGTVVFGPTCGSAKTDEGRVLDLAPCVGD